MASKEPTTIIEPTEAELKMYMELTSSLQEGELDVLANEYFTYIQKGDIAKISFAKFIIDKFIRPVREGDTIEYIDDKGEVNYLFCLIRKTIETKDYLIFAMVNKETEELMKDNVYLFFVEGKDELGIEMIDIFPSGEEAERILDLLESEEDVTVAEAPISEEKESK